MGKENLIKNFFTQRLFVSFLFFSLILVSGVFFVYDNVLAASVNIDCSVGSPRTLTIGVDLSAGDDVTLTGDGTCVLDNPTQLSLNSLIIGDDGTTPATFLTHSANTTTKTNYLDLSVTGDVTIHPDAGIDIDGKGYSGGTYSGTTGGNGSGAGAYGHGGGGGGAYGGDGGNGDSVAGDGVGGTAYGSESAPNDFGSGGGTAFGAGNGEGGGLIILNITGTFDHEGTVSSDGDDGTGRGGGGAGGGIYITTNALTGTTGEIQANGGQGGVDFSHVAGSGGGGRIAVIATTDTSTLTYTVAGGASSGGTAEAGDSGSLYISPSTPTMTAPTSGLYNMTVNPTLTTSAFAPSGVTHTTTDWFVTTDSGCSTVVWSKDNDAVNLLSIVVNDTNGTFSGALAGQTALAENTQYYACALHTSGAGDSGTATAVTFTTEFTGTAATQTWDFNDDSSNYTFNASYVNVDTGNSVAELVDLGGGTYTSVGVISGFLYSRDITITENSGVELTDYAVKVEVTYDANMQSDFDDLRFTDAGDNILNYWIESYTASTSAIVWVEVPTIAASTDTTITMHYGNGAATSLSSIGDVFTVDTIYASAGSPATDMGNHTNANTIRGQSENLGTSTVTKIDWGSWYDGSAFNSSSRDDFFQRFRFIFVPDSTGTWGFAVDSDDGSEAILNPGDENVPSGDETTVASFYGGHAVSGGTGNNGTTSLTSGEGVWVDVLHEDRSGGEGIRFYLQEPSGSYTLVNTTNFSGQLYSRQYASSEPTLVVGSETAVSDYSDVEIKPSGTGTSPTYSTLLTISHSLGGGNAGSVSYQISNDGANWYYHDGSSWETASNDGQHNNTITELNNYLPAFDDSYTGDFYFRALLVSDTSQAVELDSITLTYDDGVPSGLADLVKDSNTTTEAVLSWTPATEASFSHYEIWYGESQSDVQNRTGTATEWDDGDDANLSVASTSTTTITSGLTVGTTYYAKIWAIDTLSNETTITDLEFTMTVGGGNKTAPRATDTTTNTGSGEGSSIIEPVEEKVGLTRLRVELNTPENDTEIAVAGNELMQGAKFIRLSELDERLDELQKTYTTVYFLFRYNNLISPIYSKILGDAKPEIVQEDIVEELENIEDKEVEFGTENKVETNEDDDITQVAIPDGKSIARIVGMEPGDIFKITDNDAVYYFAEDGTRHIFPNEFVYYSYYDDFKGMKEFSAEQVGAIPLGGNKKLSPGTWLVKIVSDPKVYAVEPGGVLRHVSTENVAEKLYGPNWNKKIIDINVSLFVDYSIGEPLTDTEKHPDGVLVTYDEDNEGNDDVIYYVRDSELYQLSENDLQAFGARRKFIEVIDSNLGYVRAGILNDLL